jgi:hypothetical protein
MNRVLILLAILFTVLIVQSKQRDGFSVKVGERCIYDSQCYPMRFCRDTGVRDTETDIYIHKCSKNSGFLQHDLDFVPNLADFEPRKFSLED